MSVVQLPLAMQASSVLMLEQSILQSFQVPYINFEELNKLVMCEP